MKIKLRLISCLLVTAGINAQVPSNWTPTGIGGGGALFAPSISPSDPDDFYISSDLSALYHTTDGGESYSIFDHRQIQAFHNSNVRFTSVPGLLYSINYSNNLIVPVKSTDNGATWTTLPGVPLLFDEAFSIWVDYNYPDRIVIGYYGAIYYSSDGGDTFTKIHDAVSFSAGCLIGGILFDSDNIYIGSNDGIIYSANAGVSFTMMTTTGIPAGERISSFCAAKSGSSTRFFCLTGDAADVYCGLSGSDYWGFIKGIYRMDNANGTWVSKMGGINSGNDYLMFMAMAENNIDICYAAGSTNTYVPNVMKTIDGGENWTHVFTTANNQNITTGWCGDGGDKVWSWAECPFGFAVSASDPNIALFGDYNMPTRTTDGGVSWQQAYVNKDDEHAANTLIPVKQNYHSIGMENTACWQVFWMDSLIVYGAYTDIFGIKSTDAGKSWSFNYGYTPSNTIYRIAKDYTDQNRFYAATSTIHDMYKSYRLTDAVIDGGGGKIIYTTDKGVTWIDMHDFNDPVYWVETDPNNTNRMYASVINHSSGTGGIYRCDNILAGASSVWTKLDNPPRTEGHPASISILNDGQVLCAFSGRRTFEFTASSGVFLYDPVSDTWSDVTYEDMYYYTKEVVVDPDDPTQQTWYACVFNGWGGPGTGLGGLYRTTNGGNNWQRIFDQADVSSVTFDTNHSGLFYLTTAGSGLWTSNNIHDDTPDFVQEADYHFGNPERVFLNPYNANEVWIATFGYGMNSGQVIVSGTSDLTLDEKISVYPNPASTLIKVMLPGDNSGIIKIFDLNGKMVESFNYSSSGIINISALPEGCYIIKAETEGEILTGKVLIMR